MEIIKITLAIVGLRIVSSRGMILYFLRKPYEYFQNQLKDEEKELQTINNQLSKIQEDFEEVDNYYEVKEKAILLKAKQRNSIDLVRIYKIIIYCLKPIIGCTTCMASVWTIVISYFYFSIDKWTILNIFIVACLNSIIMALYEKLNK